MTKQQPQKAKPIIFDTESVREIIDGRKTAARTVIKLPDGLSGHIVYEFGDKGKPLYLMYAGGIKTPKYQVGDILYVKETWCTDEDMADVFEDSLTHGFYYRANEVDQDWVNDKEIVKWHPSVHMPKEAARIFLEVTDVKVERQDAQDKCKGCKATFGCDLCVYEQVHYNEKDVNPYEFVYELRRVEVEE